MVYGAAAARTEGLAGLTCGQLIALLQTFDPDAPVRHIPARSSGLSDSVYPRQADGFVSQYGQVLPRGSVKCKYQAGYNGYGPHDDETPIFPVVWI